MHYDAWEKIEKTKKRKKKKENKQKHKKKQKKGNLLARREDSGVAGEMTSRWSELDLQLSSSQTITVPSQRNPAIS